jgi:hypothetical protein
MLYNILWILVSICLFGLNDIFVNKFIQSNNSKLIYYLMLSIFAFYNLQNINNKK